MNIPWRPTKLSEVLEPISRSEPVDPVKDYRLLGVRLGGGGAFHRETKRGSQISAKALSQVKTGDFIYSRLFAWRGAFGVIGSELDGCYVSGEFPTFRPVPGELDVRFLRLWFCLPTTISRVEADCTGSTPLTRNRFKEHFFLAMEIRLPSLGEQRRIVGRIDEIGSKIEDARSLRKQTEESCQGLLRAILFDDGDAPRTAMHQLVRLRAPDVSVSSEGTYQFAGVYCFGRGMFRGAKREGRDFAYKSLTRLRAGDLVYPKLMAWEGAIAVVPPKAEGFVVSPEFPVFEVNQERVLPETLDTYFRTPSVWHELAEISTGTNVRRRRLHPTAFLSYEMPLPAMTTQLRLREVSGVMSEAKQLQAQTAADLDGLLPSILDKAFKGEL